MPASVRLIRTRVKSVKNTKKITKAMELVSAAKMRKAVAATLASRAYSQQILAAVQAIARVIPNDPPATPERSDGGRGADGSWTRFLGSQSLARNDKLGGTALLIVFTSDKGLCGGFNAQMLKTTEQFLRTRPEGSVKMVAIGKRAAGYFKGRGIEILNLFTNLSNNPTSLDIRPIAKIAVDGFLSGEFTEAQLAYTDFRSALVQKPTITQLLPVYASVIPTTPAPPGAVSRDLGRDPFGKVSLDQDDSATEYLFEPSPQKLLDAIVPRLIEVQLYQALLESNASEHSARMLNMKNASDNAAEMIEDLTFIMNQARQAGITREISEISAGKAALE